MLFRQCRDGQAVMDMGFLISIAGPVTYKNAIRLLEVVKYVPDDMLLMKRTAHIFRLNL